MSGLEWLSLRRWNQKNKKFNVILGYTEVEASLSTGDSVFILILFQKMYILQNFQDKQGFYLHEIYGARKRHIKQSNLEKTDTFK